MKTVAHTSTGSTTNTNRAHRRIGTRAVSLALALAATATSRQVKAASETWTGTTDATWSTTTNWSNSIVPGIVYTANATNTTDVATFSSNQANGTTNPIVFETNRMIGSLLFNTSSAGSYNIGALSGSPTLTLGNNLNITVAATVVNPQTINAPIAVHLPSSTNGGLTIVSNASSNAATLTLAGGILNSPNSSRGTAWTLAGTNAGNNNISGAINITNSGGIASSITKTGTGTWILSGANTIGGGITINQGTLVAANSGALGTATTTVNSSGTLEVNNVAISGATVSLNTSGSVLGTGTSGIAALSIISGETGASLGTINSGDVLTVSGVINGGSASSVVGISGPGEVMLGGGAGTYAGNWSINSGTLAVGSGGTGLGTASVGVTFGAASTGSFNLNGQTATIGSLLTNVTPGSAVIQNATGNGGTLILNTSVSNTFAGVMQDGIGGGSLSFTKSGAGTQTLTGISTYTGATNITAGKLVLSPGAGLGNSAITVNSAATFAAQPGSGILNLGTTGAGSAGATLTLNPGTGTNVGGTLNFADNQIGIVNLNQQSSFSGTALTLGGGGSLTNAPILNFDISSTHTADELMVSAGSVSIGSSSALIELAPLTGASSLATGNYTLISAPGGGLAPLNLSTTSIVLGGHSYSLSLANSTSTAEILTVAINNTTPLNAYWIGGSSAGATSWSSTGPVNWATDHTGATLAAGIPGGGTNAFMTADGASSSTLSTTLDSAFNINSLSFTGTGTTAASSSVTIAAGSGGTLTLAAANAFNNSANTTTYAAGTGIVVQAGSAAHTISAPIILAASQAWEIDNSAANPLTVGGAISDGGLGYSLTKTGVGTLILSGSNTYGGTTGSTTVTGGILQTASATAIPANLGLVANGGILDLDGNSLAVSSLGDGGVSTGSIVNTGAAATLTVGGSATNTFAGQINASNSTLAFSGTGSLTLAGTNSVAVLNLTAGSVNVSGATLVGTSTSVSAGTLNVTGSLGNTNTPAGAITTSNAGTLSIAGGSVVATSVNLSSTAGQFSYVTLASGTLTTTGALTVNSASSENSNTSIVRLLGGTATFNSAADGRTADTNLTAIQTASPINDDIYVNGATVNITTTLGVGTASGTNSSAIYHQDAGTVTVGGIATVTANTAGRYSVLDVNGGSFTSNDTTGVGIRIGGGFAGTDAELLIRGTAVVSASTITFGNATQNSGNDVLELIGGGTLYVGSGGLVNGGTTLTPTINLGATAYATAPVLAASAPWSSSLLITLTNSSSGISPTIQTANASGGAVDITISGQLEGAGGFIKTGAGTLTLTGGNGYFGTTNISAGTLNINSEYALGGADQGPVIFNGGSLQYSNPLANAVTDITFNGSSAVPVTIAAGGGTIDTNGNNINFANSIGNNGTGSLTVTGGGSLNVSGGTYTGPTTILGNTILAANAANALAPTSAFNVNNGTLDVTVGNNSIGALTIAPTGTLNLSFGAVLAVTNTASFGGFLNLTGSAGTLPETLITYNASSGTFPSANVTGIPSGDELYYGTKQLLLAPIGYVAGPSTLVWSNASADNTWNATSLNWNSGTGTVAYSDNSNTSTGDIVTFNDSAGSGGYNVTINNSGGSVHPTSVTFAAAGNYNISGTGVGIAGAASVTLTGTGTVTMNASNSYTGGTNVSAGKLVLASAAAFPANTSLTVASGATVQVANHGSSATYVPTMSTLNNTGTIDITNNALIVHGGSLSTISAQAAAAYNNGAWNGTNASAGVITSSVAASDPRHLTAVGVATGLTSFEGGTVLASDVLVKYTYYGDANLDGTVSSADYTRIDNGFLTHATGWQNGDFNYDGVINGSDYTLIDNAFNTQGATLSTEIASATAQIAGGGTSAAVPEPASLGLIGIGALGLLGRRNRRRH